MTDPTVPEVPQRRVTDGRLSRSAAAIAGLVGLVGLVSAAVVGVVAVGGDAETTPLIVSLFGFAAPAVMGIAAVLRSEAIEKKVDTLRMEVRNNGADAEGGP